MRVSVDTETRQLVLSDGNDVRELPLYSPEAFTALSALWVKVGWNEKYPYTYSWLGRPIIQMPQDMLRMQEAIVQLQPDVIVETGIAHGGSLVYNASILKLLGRGRVIGVDIEIRSHNRAAIEAHPMFDLIEMIEADSIADSTVKQVTELIGRGESVLVILDSNHSRDHVAAELEQYSPLVTPGSWIVATDGVMKDLHDVPRGHPSWDEDNPVSAAKDFLARHPEFELAPPPWPFNESDLTEDVTHWPSAWLRRKA